jgi:hypothetical protein
VSVRVTIPSPAHSAIGVRREIWRSLVSMLRVYAHAAEMNHGAFQVTETSGERVVVESREGELTLSLDARSGAVRWKRRQKARTSERTGTAAKLGSKPGSHAGHHIKARSGERTATPRNAAGKTATGRFTILADGRLDFDGEEKQLDSAAIEWVEDLTRPASRVLKS